MNSLKSVWARVVTLLLLTISIAALASCSSSSNNSNNESLRIYEMVAGKGSFSAVSGDTTGTRFQLVLSNVPADLIYFTDRPAQEAGYDTMANVINTIWPRVYGAVSPNALLQATVTNQGTIDLFCVLEKPVYNTATGQLSVTLTYLNGNQKPVNSLAVTDVKIIILNNATSTTQNEWSQLMNGATGTFTPTSTAGTYTFRIQQPSDYVFSYTNAPSRLSAKYTADAYIMGWQTRFGSVSPNVSISYDPQVNLVGGVQIVTLSNPVYDSATRSISFTAKLLYGTTPIPTSGLNVNAPSLFIDGGAADGLKVTIKNSSGRTAYVRFTGKPVSVDKNNIAITNGGSEIFTLVSSNSGRIYISYDKALSSDEPDGANTSDKDYGTRFDKIELTYTGSGGKANLTAVDFYAIPMVLETSIQGTTIEHLTLADKTTGEMLEAALTKTITGSASSTVIKGGTGGIETLRVLSSVKRPASYPAFDTYLDSIGDPSKNTRLTIAGTYYGSPAQNYSFSGTMNATEISLISGSDTIKIPLSSLKLNATDAINYNGIYTCNSPYTVNGTKAVVGDNNLYSAVYRDLVTAFNLGYVTAGTNDSSSWWSSSAKPFQNTYNPYAKTVAELYPGAYGFPFTDRYNHILADLGGQIDSMTVTLLGDKSTAPSFAPQGILNPQTGVTKFNLIIVTPNGSGFKNTPFSFNTQNYTGGFNYTFPQTSLTGSSETASTIRSVPAQNGLNIYKLNVLNKSYTVLLQVDSGKTSWGSITGGASATWDGANSNLFLGL